MHVLQLSELKQEVEHLRSLLQIEQSIHQAVTTVAASTDPTVDELKEFDRIAQEYEETVKKSSTGSSCILDISRIAEVSSE